MKAPRLPEVFVSRITRKELKTDKFALEIGHTVTLFEEHRKDIIRYGAIALAVLLILAGYVWYSRRQHSARQQLLSRAIQVQETPVGAPTPGQNTNFPTQDVKDQAAIKAFSDVRTQYPSSDEGQIAQYYLASIHADQGKLAEAEKLYKEVADRGDEKYASLAKLSLAQIYFADGRADQGEKLLRDLIARPSLFVSSDQATVLLARLLGPKKPAEARKLLEPLRGKPGMVSQTAIAALGELPAQ
jgi:predicted negative regulator of RcsB-dependent stress response